MEMNFELMVQAMPLLLTGAVVTVKITALSVFLGILIGLFVGIARAYSPLTRGRWKLADPLA